MAYILGYHVLFELAYIIDNRNRGGTKNENRIHHPVTVTGKRAYATARPGLYGSSLMGTGYIDGKKKADRMPYAPIHFVRLLYWAPGRYVTDGVWIRK